jgi:iron(III) transport system permease protein
MNGFRPTPSRTKTETGPHYGGWPELDESSRVSGRTWLGTLRLVIVPLLKPALLGGWLFVAIIITRELGISLFLYGSGTQTASIAISLLWSESITRASTASVLQTARNPRFGRLV